MFFCTLIYNNSMPMQRKQLNPKKRFLILNRDNFTCQYCWLPAWQGVQLQIDHKIPISKGWDDSLKNLITSCFECNIWKWDMDEKTIETIKENTEKNDITKKEINAFFKLWNEEGYWSIDKNTTVLLSVYFKVKDIKFQLDILNDFDNYWMLYNSKMDIFWLHNIEENIWRADCENNMSYRLNYILTEKLLISVDRWLMKNNYTIKKFSYFYNEIEQWHKE